LIIKHCTHTVRDVPSAIPFAATQPGPVPASGAPSIGGIDLPKGTAWPANEPKLWANSEEVDDFPAIAARLADRFPETGLWPLIWRSVDEPLVALDAEAEFRPEIDLENPDPPPAEDVLRERWEQLASHQDADVLAPYGTTFPGLARAGESAGDPGDRISRNPFQILAESSWPDDRDEPQRLMLIPCRRPSEAPLVAAHGSPLGERALSSIFRSWEERFAAVPVVFMRWGWAIALCAPPTDTRTAEAFAAELFAADTGILVYPGLMSKLAGALLGDPGDPSAWTRQGLLEPGLLELGSDY
jgi:hypothetical protein